MLLFKALLRWPFVVRAIIHTHTRNKNLTFFKPLSQKYHLDGKIPKEEVIARSSLSSVFGDYGCVFGCLVSISYSYFFFLSWKQH